jgi:hypothetical protein
MSNYPLIIIAIAHRRRDRLDQRPARGDDRHAADDRALQRHGRRRRGRDRRGRTVSRRALRLAGATLAVVGGIIGAVSFSGSLIAFGKLQGLIRARCASAASSCSTC